MREIVFLVQNISSVKIKIFTWLHSSKASTSLSIWSTSIPYLSAFLTAPGLFSLDTRIGCTRSWFAIVTTWNLHFVDKNPTHND